MPESEEGRRILQQLRDSLQEHRTDLKAHIAETRARDEANQKENRDWREMHNKEHREHDQKHYEIAERQLASADRQDRILDQLKAGNITMAALREQDKLLDAKIEKLTKDVNPPAWPKVLGYGGSAAIMLVSSLLWVQGQIASRADRSVEAKLEEKADKSVETRMETRIELKADKTDVRDLGKKIDLMNQTFLTVVKELSAKGR